MAKSSASSSSPKPKAVKATKTTAKTPKSSSSSSSKGSKKDQIFRHLCEQHVMGVTEVDKAGVAFAVGYTNPRSEGFTKALKELIKKAGTVMAGTTKESITLTQKGIQEIPQDLEVSNDPSSMHDRYIKLIENKAKMGADKVQPLWQILMDGKPHKVNDISIALGYKNPRSFANTKIIQAMKAAGLVKEVGKGAIQFTDKVPVVTIV